jgi:hypothetical protein
LRRASIAQLSGIVSDDSTFIQGGAGEAGTAGWVNAEAKACNTFLFSAKSFPNSRPRFWIFSQPLLDKFGLAEDWETH